jgi:hypothetical protein
MKKIALYNRVLCAVLVLGVGINTIIQLFNTRTDFGFYSGMLGIWAFSYFTFKFFVKGAINE